MPDFSCCPTGACWLLLSFALLLSLKLVFLAIGSACLLVTSDSAPRASLRSSARRVPEMMVLGVIAAVALALDGEACPDVERGLNRSQGAPGRARLPGVRLLPHLTVRQTRCLLPNGSMNCLSAFGSHTSWKECRAASAEARRPRPRPGAPSRRVLDEPARGSLGHREQGVGAGRAPATPARPGLAP